jgi:predicted  nucleic acid-binding Zn-ribbon protein
MANNRFLLGVAALLVCYSTPGLAAGNKVFKCLDKDGHIQYLTIRPPECKTENATVLDQGHEKPVETPKRKQGPDASNSTNASGEPDTPEQIEKKRHDQALLGTYSSEREIDDALKRNLQQVDSRINTIQMQIKSAQEDMDRLAKEKSDREKAGKPLDKSLLDEISQTNARIAKLQSEQNKAQAESESIKARFAADKQRYRELIKQ